MGRVSSNGTHKCPGEKAVCGWTECGNDEERVGGREDEGGGEEGGVKVQRDKVEGQTIPVNQLPPMQMRRLFISLLALHYSHSPYICVYSCAFGPLIAVGGGDKPAQKKYVCKLNNKLFTSFIRHACFSLVNTFKSICHPLPHSSCSDLHFVSHLYFCVLSLSVGTSVFRHETRQNKNIMEGSSGLKEVKPSQAA